MKRKNKSNAQLGQTIKIIEFNLDPIIDFSSFKAHGVFINSSYPTPHD